MSVSLRNGYRTLAAKIWAGTRLANLLATIRRAYYAGPGERVRCQLRVWTPTIRGALFACGWDCFARKIGTGDNVRYQLIMAPAQGAWDHSNIYAD